MQIERNLFTNILQMFGSVYNMNEVCETHVLQSHQGPRLLDNIGSHLAPHVIIKRVRTDLQSSRDNQTIKEVPMSFGPVVLYCWFCCATLPICFVSSMILLLTQMEQLFPIIFNFTFYRIIFFSLISDNRCLVMWGQFR